MFRFKEGYWKNGRKRIEGEGFFFNLDSFQTLDWAQAAFSVEYFTTQGFTADDLVAGIKRVLGRGSEILLGMRRINYAHGNTYLKIKNLVHLGSGLCIICK